MKNGKNNKFYVSTPIYYVNSKPHLGTLYSTLLADIIARWNKILGKDVFFLTGLDEHGQKVGEKANDAGLDPQAFVDSMVPLYKSIWKRYEFEYDHFVRTTDKSHEAAVCALIKKLQDKGDIYKSSYIGYYCTPCETFIAEHAVEKDKPQCSTCGRSVHEVSEESYFFRLSAYQDQLLEFYEQNPAFVVPNERINEAISFVKSGLKDLSISRKTVKWGVPFPGDSEHTVYVWVDALMNYISAVGYGQGDAKSKERFARLWPADVHMMAKDIFKFHAVYWPALLMAADLPLPKRLLVHGYLLMDGLKMSKSLGNVLDPDTLADWYGVEPIRYYLARHMAITQDGHITLEEIENSINSELGNNLGNLLNRTVTLALRNGLDTVAPAEVWEADSAQMKERCEEAFRDFWDEMNHFHVHLALGNLWKFISDVNAYFHAQQPWKLAKENKELFAEVISVVCHCLYSISLMLWPVMPRKMESMLTSLGHQIDLGKHKYSDELRKNEWNITFTLKEPVETLFPRSESHVEVPEKEDKVVINEKETEKEASDGLIVFEDFLKVEILVGQIKLCDVVRGSSKLFKLSVDLGEERERQILAGVAKYYNPDELIGRKALFVANLKPRKMMGMTSQGMLMCTKDVEGWYKIVVVDDSVQVGTRAS